MKSTEKNIPKSFDIGINHLSSRYRVITLLRVKDKLSYKEIAEKTNISEGECRNIVYRAKKKLFKLDEMLSNHKNDAVSMEDLIKRWKNVEIDGRYM